MTKSGGVALLLNP